MLRHALTGNPDRLRQLCGRSRTQFHDPRQQPTTVLVSQRLQNRVNRMGEIGRCARFRPICPGSTSFVYGDWSPPLAQMPKKCRSAVHAKWLDCCARNHSIHKATAKRLIAREKKIVDCKGQRPVAARSDNPAPGTSWRYVSVPPCGTRRLLVGLWTLRTRCCLRMML